MSTGDFTEIDLKNWSREYAVSKRTWADSDMQNMLFEKDDMSYILEPEKLAPYNAFKSWTSDNTKNIDENYSQAMYKSLVIEKPAIKPTYLFALFNNEEGVPNVVVTLNMLPTLLLRCDCVSGGLWQDNCYHIRSITNIITNIYLIGDYILSINAPSINYVDTLNLLNVNRLPLINYLPYGVLSKIYNIKENKKGIANEIGIDDYKKSRNINIKKIEEIKCN